MSTLACVDTPVTRVGIVGGGPGGLMTADLINQRYGEACMPTVFEASGRPGGKLRTLSFGAAPVPYEAGAAEIYDYSAIGDDALRRLVDDLGLDVRPMNGQTVVLDDTILRGDSDIRSHWGEPVLEAVRDFRHSAAELLPVDRWHPGSWEYDSTHPWAGRTCAELLDTVEHPVARKYLGVAAHSDLATEPHLTNGLNGLKNFVMDVPGYIGFYAIDGGMSRFAQALAARVPGRLECDARVVRIEVAGDVYRIDYVRNRRRMTEEFDAVILALPAVQLASIEFTGDVLRRAMDAHMARFDRPGHYLRISLLFRSPFWRGSLEGSWFMLDAFGGACVYDESARYDTGGYGVLGFLIAGNDALNLMNVDEGTLVARVLDALPSTLQRDARRAFMEARMHRWCGGVSGQPGGLPLGDPVVAHRPDPETLPGLLLVGDYLFDSTLNGVLRSAYVATSLLFSRVLASAASQGLDRL